MPKNNFKTRLERIGQLLLQLSVEITELSRQAPTEAAPLLRLRGAINAAALHVAGMTGEKEKPAQHEAQPAKSRSELEGQKRLWPEETPVREDYL